MYGVYTCKDFKWDWNMLSFDLGDCKLRVSKLKETSKYDKVAICCISKSGEEYSLEKEVIL